MEENTLFRGQAFCSVLFKKITFFKAVIVYFDSENLSHGRGIWDSKMCMLFCCLSKQKLIKRLPELKLSP